jgi:hypothetical protein
MNWRGGWSATEQYYLNDVVISPTDTNTYILTGIVSLLDGGDPSTNPDWSVMALSGTGVLSITADPVTGVANIGTAQNVVLVNTGVISVTADPVTGVNNVGTAADPILVNTGVISITTNPATGIQNTGTATNQILENTGVLGLTCQNGCQNTGTAQNPIIENIGVLGVTAQNGCQNTGTAANPIIENTGVLTVTADPAPANGGIITGGTTANTTISWQPLAQGVIQILNPAVTGVVTTPYNLTANSCIMLTYYNDNVVPPATPWNANPVGGQTLWWNLTGTPTDFEVQLGNTPAPVGTYVSVKWVLLSL